MFMSVLSGLSRCFDLKRRSSLSYASRAKNRVQLQLTALEERAVMSAGALDPGFSSDGKTQEFFDAGGLHADHANAVAVQADGKIVVVGYAEGPNGDRDFAVSRLNSDGSRDTSFGGGTGRVRIAFDLGGTKHDEARAVVVQPDGKIVVAGQVARINGDSDMGVIRLNSDGTLDGGVDDSTPGDAFSTDGKAVIYFDLGGSNVDGANAVALLGEKIVLAGFAQTGATNYEMAVAVLENYGDLDLNFSTGGVDGGDGRTTVPFDLGGLLIDQANAVAIQGGKIVLAGTAHTASDGVDMAVARLTVQGYLDSTFSPGGAEGSGKAIVGFNLGSNNLDAANAMVIQPDGKILLAGTVARATAGDYDFGVARLTIDGALDTATFGAGDGKTLVAFDRGGNNADEAHAVALQSDGKIVIAGTVDVDAAGNTDLGIARLTADGILDGTFGGNGRAVVKFDLGQQKADEAAGLALDSSDRIIVAGTVQRSMTGDTDFGVARLVEGYVVNVRQLANGTSVVKVRGSVSGQLLKQFGPYRGTVLTKLKDYNGDGAPDLYIIRLFSNGTRRVQVYNGLDLSELLLDKKNT
jgi:uncharacterized delta-60 repeat protein